MRRRVLRIVISSALCALAPATARAGTCAKPDFLDAFPADGSTGVPTNAELFAQYSSTAQYAGEAVTLEQGGQSVDIQTNDYDVNEGLLSVRPSNPLTPTTPYTLTWPALHGIGTTAEGRGATVKFTTGPEADLRAPAFDGLQRVDWDVQTDEDDCTNAEEDRFVFDIYPGAASDDASTSFLKLVVYQTKGPGISKPFEALVAPMPAPGAAVRLDLSIEDAVGNVCFAALVRDLLDQPSAGADKEVCTTTTPPPFFYGCGAGGHAPADGAALSLGAGLVLFGRRRRRGA